jgi:hypothetical protein
VLSFLAESEFLPNQTRINPRWFDAESLKLCLEKQVIA